MQNADLPFDLPPCVTRRQFMIQGAVASIAIVLAGCGLNNGPTAPGSVNLTINIADYPPLANVGGVAYVDANGNPLAVVRLNANAFNAFSRICPHQGGTIQHVAGRVHLSGARRPLRRHRTLGWRAADDESHELSGAIRLGCRLLDDRLTAPRRGQLTVVAVPSLAAPLDCRSVDTGVSRRGGDEWSGAVVWQRERTTQTSARDGPSDSRPASGDVGHDPGRRRSIE